MQKFDGRRAVLVLAALGAILSLAGPALADYVATDTEVEGVTCTAPDRCGVRFHIDDIQDAGGKPLLPKLFKAVSNFDAAKSECRIDIKQAAPDAAMLPFTKATYLEDQHGSMAKVSVDFIFFACKQQ